MNDQTLYTLLNHHPIACKAVFDAMAVPCLVRHADGHWVLVNHSAVQTLGADLEQLRAAGTAGAISVAWLAALAQAQQQAFATGMPVRCSAPAPTSGLQNGHAAQLLCHPVPDEQQCPAFAVFQVLDAPTSGCTDDG